MKILLAEDRSTMRKIVGRFLVDLGYEVTETADGEMAWERFQEERFRMVLTDWVMPKMNGIDLIRKIRSTESGQHTYIILLTSKEKQEDLVEGIDAGADDYIKKPFHRDELAVRIRAGERIADLQRRLEEAVVTDPLTGLSNRRRLADWSQEKTATESGKPVGFILADIDHFKKVNDTYGHEAGDSVLKAVALHLRNAFRTTDTLVRMGGEEFLVIAPGANPVHLFRLAERIRETLAETRFEISGDREIGITCSFGVTYAFPGPDLSLEDCIAIADGALYVSKETGRNRVTVRHPLSEEED